MDNINNLIKNVSHVHENEQIQLQIKVNNVVINQSQNRLNISNYFNLKNQICKDTFHIGC